MFRQLWPLRIQKVVVKVTHLRKKRSNLIQESKVEELKLEDTVGEALCRGEKEGKLGAQDRSAGEMLCQDWCTGVKVKFCK